MCRCRRSGHLSFQSESLASLWTRRSRWVDCAFADPFFSLQCDRVGTSVEGRISRTERGVLPVSRLLHSGEAACPTGLPRLQRAYFRPSSHAPRIFARSVDGTRASPRGIVQCLVHRLCDSGQDLRRCWLVRVGFEIAELIGRSLEQLASPRIFSGSIVVGLEAAGHILRRRPPHRFESYPDTERTQNSHQRRHGGVLTCFEAVDRLANGLCQSWLATDDVITSVTQERSRHPKRQRPTSISTRPAIPSAIAHTGGSAVAVPFLLWSGSRSISHTAGAGGRPSSFSMDRPMASSRRSLPSGPSISRPTGRPPTDMPAGCASPGKPALLPGSTLRISA